MKYCYEGNKVLSVNSDSSAATWGEINDTVSGKMEQGIHTKA